MTLDPDGSFTYVPADGFVGIDRFTYADSDGVAASGVATVTIAVSGVPTIDPIPDLTATTCTQISRSLAPYVHSPVPVAYAITGAPSWLAIDAATGTLSLSGPNEPNPDGQDHRYPFTLTVTSPDGTASRDLAVVLSPTTLMSLPAREQGWGC